MHLLVQLLDLDPGARAQGRIEIRERLIEEEDARFFHQRARQRHALLLPPGELPNPALQQLPNLQRFRHPLHAGIDFLLRALGELQRKGKIAVDIHVRIKGIVLKHHRHLALVRRPGGDVVVLQQNLALIDLFQTRDQVERGRFATAGWTEQRNERLARNLHRKIIDGARAAEDP